MHYLLQNLAPRFVKSAYLLTTIIFHPVCGAHHLNHKMLHSADAGAWDLDASL